MEISDFSDRTRFCKMISYAGMAAVFLILGCVHEENRMLTSKISPQTPSGSVSAVKTDLPQALSYRRIHTSDVVLLHVVPGKEFEKDSELTVNLEGEILVPLIGWTKVEGLTTHDAEEEIRKKLDQNYLVNPAVSLRIKEAKSRAVVLLGQLKKPGTYEFPQNGKMTLLEAVAKAEGFTDIANLTAIKVVRTGPDGKQMTLRVDAEKILSGAEPDISLEEGDLVTVPESLF